MSASSGFCNFCNFCNYATGKQYHDMQRTAMRGLRGHMALLGLFILAGKVFSNCLQANKDVMWLIKKFA